MQAYADVSAFPAAMGMIPGLGMPMQPAASGEHVDFSHIPISPPEIAMYESLFRLCDPDGQGWVAAPNGAEFLRRSALPTEILHEIWRLCDPCDEGYLSKPAFGVACRLVAHAQNGQMPDASMIMMEPVSLPHFDTSDLTTTAMMSFASPMVAAQGQQLGSLFVSGAAASLPAESPGTPPLMGVPTTWSDLVGALPQTPRTGPEWAISAEDRQKYLELFNRSDGNHDGYVEGEEARVILAKSGLPESTLYSVWQIADRDEDGRLNVPEFLVAVHLVSRAKKGHPMPSSIPPELLTEWNQPAIPALTGAISADKDIWELPSAVGDAAAKSAISTRPSAAPATVSDPFAETTAIAAKESDLEAASFASFGERVETLEKEKQREQLAAPRQRRTRSRQTSPPPGAIAESPDEEELHPALSKDEEAALHRPFAFLRSKRGAKVPNVATLLEAFVEGDYQLAESVAAQNDMLSKDMEALQGLTSGLKHEIVKCRKELQRQLSRRREFEGQIDTLRAEYDQLHEERSRLVSSLATTHGDVAMLQNQAIFIRSLIKDCEHDIEGYLASTNNLEAQTRSAERQVSNLATTRKTIISELRADQESLRKEESEIASLQQALGRLQRDKSKLQAENQMAVERLRQAEQDRSLLVSAVQKDRDTQGQVRGDILSLHDEKRALSLELQHRALTSLQSINTGEGRPLTTTDLTRDRKGVPNSPPALPKYANNVIPSLHDFTGARFRPDKPGSSVQASPPYRCTPIHGSSMTADPTYSAYDPWQPRQNRSVASSPVMPDWPLGMSGSAKRLQDLEQDERGGIGGLLDTRGAQRHLENVHRNAGPDTNTTDDLSSSPPTIADVGRTGKPTRFLRKPDLAASRDTEDPHTVHTEPPSWPRVSADASSMETPSFGNSVK